MLVGVIATPSDPPLALYTPPKVPIVKNLGLPTNQRMRSAVLFWDVIVNRSPSLAAVPTVKSSYCGAPVDVSGPREPYIESGLLSVPPIHRRPP